MINVFPVYLELRKLLPPDVAKQIVENYIKRKNVRTIERCCQLYGHFANVIRLNGIISPKAIRIQLRLKDITLIFHNVASTFRTDIIFRRGNVNVYIANLSKNSTQDDEVVQATELINDIKSGLFDDYSLMLALSKRIS